MVKVISKSQGMFLKAVFDNDVTVNVFFTHDSEPFAEFIGLSEASDKEKKEIIKIFEKMMNEYVKIPDGAPH